MDLAAAVLPPALAAAALANAMAVGVNGDGGIVSDAALEMEVAAGTLPSRCRRRRSGAWAGVG